MNHFKCNAHPNIVALLNTIAQELQRNIKVSFTPIEHLDVSALTLFMRQLGIMANGLRINKMYLRQYEYICSCDVIHQQHLQK